jgi:hypothetical protein
MMMFSQPQRSWQPANTKPLENLISELARKGIHTHQEAIHKAPKRVRNLTGSAGLLRRSWCGNFRPRDTTSRSI